MKQMMRLGIMALLLAIGLGGVYSPATADDITATVSAILAKYDKTNLTAADAKAINDAFRQAGVKQGKAQEEAIKAAGFDPHTISRLDPPPDHPQEGDPHMEGKRGEKNEK